MTTRSKYVGGPLDKLAADYDSLGPASRLANIGQVMEQLRSKNRMYKGKTLGEMQTLFKTAFKRQNLDYALRLYEGDLKERAEEERRKRAERVEGRRVARKPTLEDDAEEATVDPDRIARDIGLQGRLDDD